MSYFSEQDIDTRSCGQDDEDAWLDRRDGMSGARYTRSAILAQMEAQRWQASQARREQAAINGELGQAAQIIALSEVYKSLRAAGRMDEAQALKARVNAIVTNEKRARPLPMTGTDSHKFGEE